LGVKPVRRQPALAVAFASAFDLQIDLSIGFKVFHPSAGLPSPKGKQVQPTSGARQSQGLCPCLSLSGCFWSLIINSNHQLIINL
jgi:hypothetical protein